MRATTLCALLLAAAGCGRVGYDPIAIPQVDGPDVRDTAPLDAAPAPEDAPGEEDLGPDLIPTDTGPPADQADAGDLAPPGDVAPPRDGPPEVVVADRPPDLRPACNQPFSAPVALSIPGQTGDLYAP